MQKVKRKNADEDTAAPNKKPKVKLVKQNDIQDGNKKDIYAKPQKDFKKGPKDFKKGATDFKKGSKDFKKGSKDFKKGSRDFKSFKEGKGKGFNKDGKVSSKFSKESGKDDKPIWSEMKKEKKQLRLARRKAKATAEVFEVSHKAKLLAAQIQRKVVKAEFRANSCKELHNLLKSHYKSIALTHDLSRVIQVLLKYASDEIKYEIIEELLDLVVNMAQSKYGHHAVKRILKYGSDSIRHEVIKRFLGHIVSLASHAISAPVLDYAYGEFANNKEKIHMQQEFYGDIYKNTKDPKVSCLKDAYKDSPEMRAAILQSCKANIQKILDKNLHDSELLHSVLYDYIRECSGDDRAELVSTLSPLIVPLSNSLPGVNAASLCVWQGTNKDKKTILKVVKEHAVSLSKHKTGYRLLLAIFDSVDDTVLVKKAIVSTLASNLKDIVKDHWGIMTIHWLVKPRDTASFHPTLIQFLAEGAKSGTSKKDADIRTAELREAILPAVKADIETDPEFWLSGKAIMLLTVAVLSIECTKEMLDALAKVICQPDWQIAVDGKQVLAVEDAGIHMCLKKLACLDKDKTENTLGEAVNDHLKDDISKVWLPTNRGCFFLLKLIENNKENVSSKLLKKLKAHISILKQQTSEGAKILLQNVQKK